MEPLRSDSGGAGLPESVIDLCTAGGVRLERPQPAVLRVVLARPERRNAQTRRTWAALAAVAAAVPAAVRAVVATGEGPSFSAGLDRDELTGPSGVPSLAALGDDELTAAIAGFQEAFTGWRRPGVLSVAAVAGHAVGAGFQLALSCDLRVCADDASFAMRETSLGLVPDLGGTARLVQLVGEPRAIELCLTGRALPAGEAAACGLAELVVPRAELAGAVDDLLAAVLTAPQPAVAATLDLLRAAAGGAAAAGSVQQLARERAAQLPLLRALAASSAGSSGSAGGGQPSPADSTG